MLSARALLFAGLVAIVVLCSIWAATPPLTLLARLLLIVTTLACVADGLLAARRRLHGRVADSGLLPLGREVSLGIDLEVEPPSPAVLDVRAQLPAGLETQGEVQSHLHPGSESARMEIRVRAVALGVHGHVSLPARVLGPLGLTWWRKEVPLDRPLRVVPDPAMRPPERQRIDVSGNNQSRTAGEGADYFQLRPYRVGDPRSRIDWKATARGLELITRDVSVEQRREVMLLLDVGRASRTEIDGLSRLGHFVNLASRLVALASRNDDALGLIAYADQPLVVVPPSRAAAGASRLQRELAQLTARARESNPLLAMLRLQTVVRHRTLVVLMTDIDDTASATQLATALGIIARRHLPIVVDLESVAVEELEGAEPREWQDPWVALAAQEFRAQQRRNVRRLSQLGCQVALVRPATAEERVAKLYESIKRRRQL
jgi:uncharacterized protein (DUF58 family)